MVNKIRAQIIGQLLPSFCLLCSDSHSSSSQLCSGCQQDLPFNTHACRHCALPVTEGSQFCGSCLTKPPAYDRCISPFRYEPPVADFIHAFKYRRDFASGGLLAELLVQGLKEHYASSAWPDLLIPVPMHWRRLWVRGFNHSTQLSKSIHRQLKSEITFNPGLLKRVKASTPQSQLNAKERQRNLKGAFKASKQCRGLRIALLDDVITTGSTIDACCDALKKSGAMEVDVWSIARTPATH